MPKWKQTGVVKKGMVGRAVAKCEFCGRVRPLDDLKSFERDDVRNPLRADVTFGCRNWKACQKYIEGRKSG